MKHALFFFFSFCYSFCIAQNLVPNPSFEDTVMCPNYNGSIIGTKDWYAAANTPDYFHECVNNTNFSVPLNQWCRAYAATGMAYCGFEAYSTLDTIYRESIGVRLLTFLLVGSKYFISFKLHATSNYWNAAANKLGMLFSTVQLTNYSKRSNYCHVWTDSIITDTTKWTYISGSFVADSAYIYLTIGNFFPQAEIDTIRLRPRFPWQGNGIAAYYFIDDVCVSEDSLMCADNTNTNVEILESKKLELAVYPNPANKYLSIETEINTEGEVELYTLSGQVLLKQKIPRGYYRFNTDVAQIANGIYFLKLINKNQIFSRKIIIQH